MPAVAATNRSTSDRACSAGFFGAGVRYNKVMPWEPDETRAVQRNTTSATQQAHHKDSMISVRANLKSIALVSLPLVAISFPSVFMKASAATESANFQKAQSYYAAGDIKSALTALDEQLKRNSQDAYCHYLKGNCLLKEQKRAQALGEYAIAEQLAPGSKLAEYCRVARANILSTAGSGSLSVPLSASARRNPRVIDDAEDGDAVDRQVGLPLETTTAVSGTKNSLPSGTLELIRKQAVLAREHALQTGQLEAEGELAKAENAAKSLREKAERAASHTRGSSEVVNVSPQEAEAMRAQAAASGDQIREWGKMKAAVKEWESQEKADEIKQQADNLQNRLLDSRTSRYSDVKLNPVGTNLYIRNYAKPPVVPLKVKAKMASLDSTLAVQKLDGKVRGGKPDAARNVNLSTSPDGTTNSRGARSVVTVKGQVIPK